MELPDIFEKPEVRDLIKLALVEDLGPANVDVSSASLVPPEEVAEAHMVARESCRLAGITVAAEVFKQVNPALDCEILSSDGSAIEKGTTVLVIKGSAQSILTAERTALNFIQRMSGVATVTAEYVETAGNPDVMLLDTRKTTPALRPFEKYSVLCGGGTNHR
ncbi:MAG: nicotinate-nucleotide diphosphorylase (carboxylating), partial [Verrucomicrobia bacterium]|nr:nicotinate-nucleotide diphosphorylase (carboxylating) [Verrucomicrobiota bacterium]